MTTTVEGRERYAIRVRYPRELRDDPEALKRVYIPTATGQPIPLGSWWTFATKPGRRRLKARMDF